MCAAQDEPLTVQTARRGEPPDEHPCDYRSRCGGTCRCTCGPCQASRVLDRGLTRLAEGRAHPLPCTDPTCTWHAKEASDV